jgi:hypothetical protein
MELETPSADLPPSNRRPVHPSISHVTVPWLSREAVRSCAARFGDAAVLVDLADMRRAYAINGVRVAAGETNSGEVP